MPWTSGRYSTAESEFGAPTQALFSWKQGVPIIRGWVVLVPTFPVTALIRTLLGLVVAHTNFLELDHSFCLIPVQLHLNFFMSPRWLV